LPAVRIFRCRAAGLALLAVAAASCGGGSKEAGGPASAASEARSPVGFRTETFTFTESGADPASAGRSLVTTVYYPAASGDGQVAAEGAPPATARGPLPLVLFSHGGGTTGTSYSNLLTRVASAGYVVAAPNYGGQTGDPTSRPADARFVISQVLTTSADPTHPLAGLVDSRRVAAMGHSMGGGITLGFVFNTCCLDDRVQAAVLLASARPAYPGEAFPPPGVPALVVHGDADTRAPYAEGRRLFEQMRSPKYLLTIHGGEHTPPFSGETQRADARIVVESIVAFLDRHLKGDPTALDRLAAAAGDPLVATLERG
jgi:dipeptidyl aminopeptidase/acylaminoacyl peptidase